MAEVQNQRDLILNPGQFAFLQDETKGPIDVVSGPLVVNLSGTQRTMLFDDRNKKFVKATSLEQGIQTVIVAPERYYVILYNPEPNGKVPETGAKTTAPKLQEGHKVVMHGPVSVTPWPGQMVKRFKGHTLRSNQYVMIEVYDVTSAKANWSATFGDTKSLASIPSDITVGQRFIVRGDEMEFFMPFTGVEIVRDEQKNAVREACTLSHLEYCVLIDESGNTRNERGPKVVFPKPTEVFKTTSVEKDGTTTVTRKNRAYELQPTQGLHFKVIDKWTSPDGTIYNEGDEVFITGEKYKLFYPDEHLALIRYDGHEVHYATFIPKGAARYVVNKLTGLVRMQAGEAMVLLDPREEVFYTRGLDLRVCEDLYPGNMEALKINAERRGINLEDYLGTAGGREVKTRGGVHPTSLNMAALAASGGGLEAFGTRSALLGDSQYSRGLAGEAAKSFGGESLNRSGQYVAARAVNFDTVKNKYEGAPMIKLWAGFAMMLVATDGTSRVEQGPKTILLNYDEEPAALRLSTGTPKSGSGAPKIRTVYLRHTNNKVSDQLVGETNDFVHIQITLSYRLNFTGDPAKWFSVEDYVGFLTDQLRTDIRRAISEYNVNGFYPAATEIIRDALLGVADAQGNRKGYTFEQNGVHIYDVDVTNVRIVEPQIAAQFVEAKKDLFMNAVQLDNAERKLTFTREFSQLQVATSTLEYDTSFLLEENSRKTVQLELDSTLAEIRAQEAKDAEQHAQMLAFAVNTTTRTAEALKNARSQSDHQIFEKTSFNKIELDFKSGLSEVESKAMVAKLTAISPQLAHAMSQLAETGIIKDLAGNFNVLSVLGGSSVVDVFKKLFGGTRLANILTPDTQGNGSKSVHQ